MEDWVSLARYLAAGLAMGFGAIGPAIGVGMAGGSAVFAMQRQPKNSEVTFRTMLLGQALSETPGIFALVIALLLGFTSPTDIELHTIGAMLGSGLAIGMAAIGAGIGLGLVTAQACENVSRNPRTKGLTERTMILGMAITESPCVFAFVIALCLELLGLTPAHSFTGMAKFLAAGACVGFGCIGSGMGEGYAASRATFGAGRFPLATGAVTRTMILGQAIAESPAVFTLVIAIILVFVV